MTDLESLILTKLGEHRPNDLFCGECDCGYLFDSDYAEHLASVLTEAATDAGYVLCREQVGTADFKDQLISIQRPWHTVPYGIELPHPVFIPVSDPSEGE